MNINETDGFVYKVVGGAITLLNSLGHGLRKKTYERAFAVELGQMLNYLKITQKNIGLTLNFKHAKQEWRKITYSA